MTSRILFSAVALAALSLLTACGGGDASEDNAASQAPTARGDTGGIGGSGLTTLAVRGGGTATPQVGGIGGSGVVAPSVGGIGGSGILSVGATRACGLLSVNVTIAGARVNADGAAGLDSAGWLDVPVAAPVRTDLLKLATGDGLPLDFSALPDGTYRQIRLLLVADDAASPLADSVVTADRQETALAVPAAAQGGLPLASTITVAQGQVAASFGGLDACKAVSSTAGVYALDAASSNATQVASAY
jgi:hypothetical protein